MFKKTLTTTLLLLAAAITATAQVSITWIGQSCFLVRSTEGTVVTDPPAASIGYRLPSMSSNGSQRGPNTIGSWTQGGLRFAHLGDLGQEQLTEAQRADLASLDVLFILAGGLFTITPERAAQYVRELRPKIAIPMHYRTALAGPAQTAGLPDAAAPFSPMRYKPATVTVSRAALPEITETWVMLPASDASAVNAASFEDAAPVAPGSVVAVFGTFGVATSACRPGK